MTRISKNCGMSSLALLALLIVVVFLGLCAFKVTPLYYHHIMLNSVITGLDVPVGKINDLNNAELRDFMGKSFRINSIEIDTRDINISRNNNQTTISYSYDAKADLFYNLSVVAHFEVLYPKAP